MFNLIKADLYKSFHRIYLYIFMAVLAAFAIFINSIAAANHALRESVFQDTLSLLIYPVFFVVMFVDIMFGEENKEHTMKNTISFGISRVKIFITKIISAILAATAVAAVTLGVFYVCSLVLLKPGKGYTVALLSSLGLKIAIAILIYIAAIVVASFFSAFIKRNGLFIFSYYGFLIIPVLLFQLLSLVNPVFMDLKNSMLMMLPDTLAQATSAQMLNVVWISLAHIAVFGVLGTVLFKRQEIN